MTKKSDQASKEEIDAAAGLAEPEYQADLIERDNRTVIDGGKSQLIEGAENAFVAHEPTHAEKTASLIARIDAHEAEGAAIEAVMTELGHDAKSIRTIKRARAKAEAAKRTYDALFGAGIVSPGQV